MAVYDLEEQEQLDELKTWWKQYGNLVTGLLATAALAAAGWQGWNWWQRSQSAQASAIYAGVQQAAMQGEARRARELAGELIDKFGGTSYAGMGALLAAKTQVDAGDLKNAETQLGWAADKADDAALRDLARLRLAVVLADQKSYDAALARLATEPAPAFAARYAEVRGDILLAQGKKAEARTTYQAAVDKVAAAAKEDGQDAYRDALRAKLEVTGGSK